MRGAGPSTRQVPNFGVPGAWDHAEKLVCCELITPAGLEELFRELGTPGVELDPATLPALAARYGCQVDFPATATILQRHGLRF